MYIHDTFKNEISILSHLAKSYRPNNVSKTDEAKICQNCITFLLYDLDGYTTNSIIQKQFWKYDPVFPNILKGFLGHLVD